MNDIEAQIELYRKADRLKVNTLKNGRRLQTILWTQCNYPAACWELRRRQMADAVALHHKFWNGTIRMCSEVDEHGSYE